MGTASILIRLVIMVFAFRAADQTESTLWRVLGFAWLLIAGIFGTIGAIGGGHPMLWLLGPGALIAAFLAFWRNH